MKSLQARLGATKLQRIQFDGAFRNEELTTFCHNASPPIDIRFSPPHEHESQGVAESLVNTVKSLGRALLYDGGGSEDFRALAWKWAATLTTFNPSSVSQGSQSPIDIWLNCPLVYHGLERPPFLCRAVVYTGNRPNLDRTTGQRGTSGVFCGWADNCRAYLIYNLDTRKMITAAEVKFFPSSFPFRDILLAGERLPHDGLVNVNNWRQSGNCTADQVSDKQLALFLSEKKLVFELPEVYALHLAPAVWIVRAARRVVHHDKSVELSCIVIGFTGEQSDLETHGTIKENAWERNPMAFSLPVSSVSATVGAQGATGTASQRSVRAILGSDFAKARTLAEVAQQSAGRYGIAPLPDSLQCQPSSGASEYRELADSLPGHSGQILKLLSSVWRSPSLRFRRRRLHLTIDVLSDQSFALGHGISLSSDLVCEPDRLPNLHESRSGAARTRKRLRPSRHSGGAQGELQSGLRGGGGATAGASQGESNILPQPRRSSRLHGSTLPPAGSSLQSTSARSVHFATPTPAVKGPSNIPKSVSAAAQMPAWKEAMERELSGLHDKGAYRRTTWAELPPGVKPMRANILFDERSNPSAEKPREKCRLVIDGSTQDPMPPPSRTYASTPAASAVRTLLAIATQLNEPTRKWDFSQAFLQSDDLPDDSTLYTVPPAAARLTKNEVWKLLKPVYGLPEATQRWQAACTAWLLATGWRRVVSEDVYFIKNTGKGTMRAVVHIDDLLWSGSTAAGDDFVGELHARWQGAEECADTYIGIQIERDLPNGVTKIHQSDFIEKVLARFGMQDSNPVYTPLQTSLLKANSPLVTDPVLRLEYQELVGCLQHLGHWTRPDLSHTNAQLARFLNNPGEEHMRVAKRTLRYLAGSRRGGITYTRQAGVMGMWLWGSVDSDWAGDADSRRSYGGYAFHLHGGVMSWRSKQHAFVSLSTAEAEFVSASSAAKEAVWLRRLFEEWGFPQRGPTPLYEDNRACILMSESPGTRERSKHIDLRVHDLKDKVAAGVVRLVACPSADMPADMLTKPLGHVLHRKHYEVLSGRVPPTAPSLEAFAPPPLAAGT